MIFVAERNDFVLDALEMILIFGSETFQFEDFRWTIRQSGLPRSPKTRLAPPIPQRRCEKMIFDVETLES